MRDAERSFRGWLADLDETVADEVVAVVATGRKFGSFAERWIARVETDPSLAPATVKYWKESLWRVRNSWEAFRAEPTGPEGPPDLTLDDMPVDGLSEDVLIGWAWAASQTYAPSSYNNILAAMKRILDLAVTAGLLRTNPADGLRRIAKRRRGAVSLSRPGVGLSIGEAATDAEANEAEAAEAEKFAAASVWLPTMAQLEALFQKMRGFKFGPSQRAADFAEVLAFTGCRLSEAGRLRWADVDFKKRCLRIDGAKGRRGDGHRYRWLPFTSRLEKVLLRLHAKAGEGKPTGCPAPGDPVCLVRECRITMQRAARNLEWPRTLSHHDLRHWFTSWAISEGVPIAVVADWLGHRDGGALLLKTYRHAQQDLGATWAAKLS